MKITKEMKASIITKALVLFRRADFEKIETRRVALGIELYEHTYGAVEAAVLALPEEWREMSEAYRVNCDGYEVKTSWRSTDDDLDAEMPLGRLRPFPTSYTSCQIEVSADHPLYPKFAKLVKDHDKLIAARQELREKIVSLLSTVNTDKQLQAAWPEALDFLPKTLSMTTALVPVGLSDQINKALGLPSKADSTTAAIRQAASH